MASRSDRPSAPATATDLDLLRHFEPILRFTKGEEFFPLSVEDYVRECSLWAHHVNGEDELLVKQGDLTMEKLIKLPPAGFGTVHYLRFIETLNLTDAAHVLSERIRIHFNKPDRFFTEVGRLTRGGFLPRVADALFSLALLLRGRVPAATAAAAELAYLSMMGDPLAAKSGQDNKVPKYVYYGRVYRANGWIVLQYWFFYCYNNWRTGYQGVNDHESDWEHVSIYLYEEDNALYPEWAAFASHDFHGDDMRRRWDDGGELTVIDGHPVVYVGAGSHASYFRRGEYQAEVSLPMPNWLKAVVRGWRRFWTEVLDQQVGDPFRIPFVDYARGDGVSIGSGTREKWTPVLIDPSIAWVSQYRGLWGLYARDPISGENAPAGPMYNRDGTPRLAWYDPLGFAGLDKASPPPKAFQLLEEECKRIGLHEKELDQRISKESVELQALGIRLKGMEGSPHLAKQYASLSKKIEGLSRDVKELRREFSENEILLESLQKRLADLRQGVPGDPRSHIQHLAAPAVISRARYDRAIETWAAISLGLLLVGAAGLLLFTPGYFWGGILILILIFLLIEGGLRGAFAQTLSRITIVLGLASIALVLIHFWKQVIALCMLGAAIYLLTQWLSELRWRNILARK